MTAIENGLNMNICYFIKLETSIMGRNLRTKEKNNLRGSNR